MQASTFLQRQSWNHSLQNPWNHFKPIITATWAGTPWNKTLWAHLCSSPRGWRTHLGDVLGEPHFHQRIPPCSSKNYWEVPAPDTAPKTCGVLASAAIALHSNHAGPAEQHEMLEHCLASCLSGVADLFAGKSSNGPNASCKFLQWRPPHPRAQPNHPPSPIQKKPKTWLGLHFPSAQWDPFWVSPLSLSSCEACQLYALWCKTPGSWPTIWCTSLPHCSHMSCQTGTYGTIHQGRLVSHLGLHNAANLFEGPPESEKGWRRQVRQSLHLPPFFEWHQSGWACVQAVARQHQGLTQLLWTAWWHGTSSKSACLVRSSSRAQWIQNTSVSSPPWPQCKHQAWEAGLPSCSSKHLQQGRLSPPCREVWVHTQSQGFEGPGKDRKNIVLGLPHNHLMGHCCQHYPQGPSAPSWWDQEKTCTTCLLSACGPSWRVHHHPRVTHSWRGPEAFLQWQHASFGCTHPELRFPASPPHSQSQRVPQWPREARGKPPFAWPPLSAWQTSSESPPHRWEATGSSWAAFFEGL